MVKEKDNYFEIKFWKEWLYADHLKRETMVKGLPFIKSLSKINKFPKEARTKILATSLNSFFEDLERAVYQKSAFEQKNNSNKNQN